MNPHESFKHYYIHGEDLVIRFKKNSVEPFNILKSNKSQNLEQ